MCGKLVSQLALVMDIVKKAFFIFDIPKTITIESSMSFSHLDSLWEIIWLLASYAHIFEHGFLIVGGFIIVIALDIRVILKKGVCSSNLAL